MLVFKFQIPSGVCDTLYKTTGKTKNKMGGHHPDGHLTDLRNIRMVEVSRGQRSMEASSEGCHVPKGDIAP
jgi:hypothetical protein